MGLEKYIRLVQIWWKKRVITLTEVKFRSSICCLNKEVFLNRKNNFNHGIGDIHEAGTNMEE